MSNVEIANACAATGNPTTITTTRRIFASRTAVGAIGRVAQNASARMGESF
jgi:hypothetical protein